MQRERQKQRDGAGGTDPWQYANQSAEQHAGEAVQQIHRRRCRECALKKKI
jgi:hypothetical protein